jgi:hypothetical protein
VEIFVNFFIPYGHMPGNRSSFMGKLKLIMLAGLAFPPGAAFAQECDAVFNPAKKFCHDGAVYDLCDGMEYDPTTHVCSDGVAYRALCNGVQYNPLAEKCGEPQEEAASAGVGVAAAAAAESTGKGQCMDRLISGVRGEIPARMQDCPIELGKNKAKAALPFSKVPAEDTDPRRFIPKCVVSGIKAKFPAADRFAGSVESFAQNAISAAVSAGGDVDVPKLLNAASSMDGLLRDIEKSLANASEEELCREPEAPAEAARPAGGEAGEKEKGKFFSLGLRAGFNLSRVYEEATAGPYKYSGFLDNAIGFQAGLAFDFALSDWFHLQPNLMLIRKGAKYEGNGISGSLAENYLEVPVLVSVKIYAIRLNAGPYFSLSLGASDGNYESGDYGISLGGGFDISDFYIGMFYDYGLADVNKREDFNNSAISRTRTAYNSYNYALGFILGYNL